MLLVLLVRAEIEVSRKRKQKDGLNQNDITEGRREIQKHSEIYLPICFYETASFSRRLAKKNHSFDGIEAQNLEEKNSALCEPLTHHDVVAV